MKVFIPIFIAASFCSCNYQTMAPSENNQTITALQNKTQNKKTSSAINQVGFKLNFNKSFRVNCSTCKPNYIRLQIKGPLNISTPLYAIGADDNGFIPIDNQNTINQISANVPEGNNWLAYASLHVSDDPEQKGLAEIGGVFHNPPPTDAQIELSKRALQTAQIIDAMHQIDAPQVFTALDLQRYQAMTDALLGVEQQIDGTYIMNRVPDGELLDSQVLAQMLKAGTLDPDNPTQAQELSVESLNIRPKVKHSIRLQAFTAGLSKLVFNSESKQLFSFDIKQNNRRIYGLSTPTLTETLNPYDLGELRNVHLALGNANPSGSSQIPVSYTYVNQGVDRMVLQAHRQDNGQKVWDYMFDDIPALRSDYIPSVWNNTKDTADTSDDTDRIYVTFNADRFSHSDKRGVYAIEDGTKIWSLPLEDDFNAAGALSQDGSRLYLIGRSNPITPSKLYAIDTTTGTLLWSRVLEGQTFTSSTPVIGKNGNIYLNTYTMPNDFQLGDSLPGVLHCYAPNGEKAWDIAMASATGKSPVIDYRDGQDIIYMITDRARLRSINGTGTERWSLVLPGTVGEGPVDAPLIGENLDGSRTLYQGMGNGLIYAIRDQGNTGNILWAQAPGGKISNGMILHEGHLYAPTLDGGEGQMVHIKTVQVQSQKLAETAPWPLTGGNLSGQSISALATKGQ